MSASDIANWVTIASLPIAILTWLFTREVFAKFWKRSWKFLICGTALLAIFGAWRFGWLNCLGAHINLPLWAVISLALSGFVIVPIAIFVLRHPQPEYLNYVVDTIFDIEWHWQYLEGSLKGDTFSAFCPEAGCSCRLHVEGLTQSTPFGQPDTISLQCQNCGLRRDYNTSWSQLRHRAMIEVERRIRTGEFREHLKDDSTSKSPNEEPGASKRADC